MKDASLGSLARSLESSQAGKHRKKKFTHTDSMDHQARRESRYLLDREKFSRMFTEQLIRATDKDDPVRHLKKVLERIGNFIDSVVCDDVLLALNQHKPVNLEALNLMLPWSSLRTHHRVFQQAMWRRDDSVVLTMLLHPGPTIQLGIHDPTDHTKVYDRGSQPPSPTKQEDRFRRMTPASRSPPPLKRQFAPGQVERLRKKREESNVFSGGKKLLRTLPEGMGGSALVLGHALALAVEQNNSELVSTVLELLFDPEIVVDNTSRTPFIRHGNFHWCLGALHKAKARAEDIARQNGWTHRKARYEAEASRQARRIDEFNARLEMVKAALLPLKDKARTYEESMNLYKATIRRLEERQRRKELSTYSPGQTTSLEGSYELTAGVLNALPQWLHRREEVVRELDELAKGMSRAHQQKSIRASRKESVSSSSVGLAAGTSSHISGLRAARPSVLSSYRPVSAPPNISVFSGHRPMGSIDRAQADAFLNASWDVSCLTGTQMHEVSTASEGAGEMEPPRPQPVRELDPEEKLYLKEHLWEQSRIKLEERLRRPTSKDEDEYSFRVLLKAHPEWAAAGADDPEFNGMCLLHIMCKYRAAVFRISPELMHLMVAAYPAAAYTHDCEYTMTPLHLLCFCSNFIESETLQVLLDSNPGAARKVDKGDNYPLHRVFVNRTQGLKVDSDAVGMLLSVHPQAASHARAFDLATPLHLLARSELLVSHHHEVVVDMVGQLRTASATDPAPMKDHAGRVAADYARARTDPVHPAVLDALDCSLQPNSSLTGSAAPLLLNEAVALHSASAASLNTVARLQAELKSLERKIARNAGPQQTWAEIKEEHQHTEKELAWLRRQRSDAEKARFRAEEKARRLSPVVALLEAAVELHGPYDTHTVLEPRDIQIQRDRALHDDGAAEIFSDWAVEQDTRQAHNNELRGPRTNSGWCYGETTDERQKDLPPKWDQATSDLLGIHPFSYSFVDDAERHPVLHPPKHGNALRWASPGLRAANTFVHPSQIGLRSQANRAQFRRPTTTSAKPDPPSAADTSAQKPGALTKEAEVEQDAVPAAAAATEVQAKVERKTQRKMNQKNLAQAAAEHPTSFSFHRARAEFDATAQAMDNLRRRTKVKDAPSHSALMQIRRRAAAADA